jgi:hypothetical protein
VIWANCVTGGPHLAEVLGRLGLSLGDLPALTRPSQTMELAWLLSGLAHELERDPSASARNALLATREALLGRFVAASRTFQHATDDAPPLRRMRRWVANFADQVYPIQALALSAMRDGDGRALAVAAASAEQMVASQGALGQWWWHYDARDGRVAQGYPVYSVHQHGMAPMALHALAAAGGPAFDEAIERGEHWIFENESGSSLIDETTGTIWRDIERDEGPGSRFARRVRSVLGLKRADECASARLFVNRETRPYEWAWCLYASAVGPRSRFSKSSLDGPNGLKFSPSSR